LIAAAALQKKSGGLPQKGSPASNWGIIQFPVSAISREISAYLPSDGSISGKAPRINRRKLSTAAIIARTLTKPGVFKKTWYKDINRMLSLLGILHNFASVSL
jgi:hypothetical protein